MWSQHCTSCHSQGGILVSGRNPWDPVWPHARWVGYSMQPSGDTLLLTCSTHRTLQLRERGGLRTSEHTNWGKICKFREFYEIYKISSCASLVLLLSWIIELLENTLQTPQRPTSVYLRQPQLGHLTLVVKATSALAWTLCWLGLWSSPALPSVMGLRWAVRLGAFVRLSGSVVTQDFQGRVKIHHSFMMEKK